MAVVAGLLLGQGAARRDVACGGAGGEEELVGYLVAPPRGGRGSLRVVGHPCAGEVRVILPDSLRAGVPLEVRGAWSDVPGGSVFRAREAVPLQSGRLADKVRGLGWTVGAGLTRWRAALVRRLEVLYGDKAPLVTALTLARKEGMDPALREAFARSGTAHLMAISGFHVGVVALMLVVLLRRAGVRRRQAALGSSMGSWLYVALLGFPDAAARAALMLTVVAASRARGRPPARWGALGGALLFLVALDPSRLVSPGFQLSFAGAGGLVLWGRGATRWSAGRLRLPASAASAVGAGVAATAATLPVVAWHFERVSLVGIPATLVETPLVVVALPGALASLAADAVHPAAGRFLAGGVQIVLAGLEMATRAAAAPEWSSVWVSRSWVAVLLAGALLGRQLLPPSGVGARVRRWALAGAAAAALASWPVVTAFQARGTVDVVALDVGQGDAIALRTPGGRWILVDAGPPRDGDPGAHPVVRALRRLGVARLEALVLTHPDLDHIGGAPAVLASFPVGRVMDPGVPAGKDAYVGLLEEAAEREIPWSAALRGGRVELDGVVLEVLSPDTGQAREGADANATSVVLALRFGAFDALLTGDAPVEVERRILPGVTSALEVLKVGHHGSSTSTDSSLLEWTHPQIALVSVGRGTRYGHPAPEVLARLEGAGVEIHRTDRMGRLRVRGRRDGTFQVGVEYPSGR